VVPGSGRLHAGLVDHVVSKATGVVVGVDIQRCKRCVGQGMSYAQFKLHAARIRVSTPTWWVSSADCAPPSAATCTSWAVLLCMLCSLSVQLQAYMSGPMSPTHEARYPRGYPHTHVVPFLDCLHGFAGLTSTEVVRVCESANFQPISSESQQTSLLEAHAYCL
jgi:hypothetical protein